MDLEDSITLDGSHANCIRAVGKPKKTHAFDYSIRLYVDCNFCLLLNNLQRVVAIFIIYEAGNNHGHGYAKDEDVC